MQIRTQADSIALGVSAQLHIERRLRFGLGRLSPRIRRVTLRVVDARTCIIEIRLLPTGIVVIRETADDLYAAIDRAADGAARSASLAVKRARDGESDSPSGVPRHASTLLDSDE